MLAGEHKGSRQSFREFLRAKGIFGDRPEEGAEGEGDETGGSDTADGRDARASNVARSGRGWAYLRRFLRTIPTGQLVLVLVLSPVALGTNAMLPWSVKIFVDTILPRRDLGLLYAAVGAFCAVGLLSVALMAVQDLVTRRLMGNFITGMKRRTIKHLQRMSLDRLQDLKVGGAVSRLQSDTEAMTGLLHQGILSPFNATIMMCICLGSLFYVDWRVTLVCFGFCFLIVGAAYLFFRRIRPLQKALREELAHITAHATEIFGGLQVVRGFGRERTENLAYGLETHLLWRKGFHAELLNVGLHRIVRVIYWLLNAAIWAVAGTYVIRDRITLGDMMIFFFFIRWLFMPVFMIMSSFAQLQRSLACAERVFDLLDEPADLPDRPGARGIEGFERGLQLEAVAFRYPDGTQALTDVDFAIPKGSVTALVGPSGAGKSTVANLVMRFYDVTEGRILLDGTDIRDLRLASYRRLMGLVLQDVFLFDGTIQENIAYGRMGATRADVEAAARTAHAHEFVAALEDGYDTVIGERGVKLSGGQKQRIALARAVLSDPQILILDEATSNLDSESEALIQDALQRIFESRTTLVIAHRLSTVMDADNIVVLDNGRKVEEGTHEALLARRGRYHELYTKQMEKAERSKQFLSWNDGEAEESSSPAEGE